MNVAMAWTEVTMNAATGFRLPPAPFVQLVELLEDLQLAYGRILLPFNHTPTGASECRIVFLLITWLQEGDESQAW